MKQLLLSLVLLVLTTAAWAGGSGESPDAPLTIFVTIPPQAYFVDRVGGGLVDTEVLVPAGADPHTYEPTPRQIVKLGTADIYFSIGLGLEENILGSIGEALPNLKIVPMTEGVEDQVNGDPHVWLDPRIVREMVKTTVGELASVAPEHAQVFQDNAAGFLQEIDALDQEIATQLAPYAGRSVLVFHPAFGPFLAAYGIRQVAIEVHGNRPGPAQLESLIQLARDEDIHVVFTQPAFDAQAAARIAEAIDGTVVPLDHLAYDWPANLRAMAVAIRDAFH